MAAKKLFYKIGEACKQLDIQPYVLRYWETEFPALAPSKSRSGQRVYSDEDLRVIHRIKELLYEEGFTIAGAKKRLATLAIDADVRLARPADFPAFAEDLARAVGEVIARHTDEETAGGRRFRIVAGAWPAKRRDASTDGEET